MAKTTAQVEFEANTSEFSKGIKTMDSDLKTLRSELKLNSSELKNNSDNVDLLSSRKKLLQTEIEKSTTKIDLINKKLDEAKILFGEDSKEVYSLNNALLAAKTQQQSLQNELKETTKQLKEKQDTLKKTTKALDEFGENTVKAGKKLSVLSAGISALIGISTSSAISFESAFTGVVKTVDGTAEELDNIRVGIRQMSKELPASANEIAGVAEAAGQLGIKTPDILDFTKVMINLGEATNLSATEGATALAKFANITNMSANDYSKLGSVIVALGNNFATTESDIVAMATRLASTGELAGLSQAQIMALATSMSSVGIEAEAGGSAMSKLLKTIQVSVETSDSKLKQFASVAGMTTQQFKKAFQEDAIEALSQFIGGLNNTERTGKSAIVTLDEMGLTEVRLSNTILSLANANGVMSGAIDLANNAWDENNALTKEAETRYATTESKLSMAKNRVIDLGISFGDIVLPKVIAFTEKLQGLCDWFDNLSEGTKGTILTIATFVAIMGPTLIVIGKMATGVSTMIKGYQGIKKILEKVTLEQIKLNLAFLANPITWIILGITALVVAFVLLWNKCEGFRNFWIGLWDGIKGIVSDSINSIKGIFNGILDFIKNNWQNILLFLVNPFAFAFKMLYEKCDGFRNFINTFVENVKQVFLNIVNWINVTLVQPIVSLFTMYLIPIFSKIIEMIAKIGEIIVMTFVGIALWIKQTVLDPIVKVISDFFEWIAGVFIAIWAKILEIFTPIGAWFADRWTDITNAFKGALDWFSNLFNSIFGVISNLFGNVGNWFKDRFQEAYNSITSVFSGIGNFFSGLWNTISHIFSDLGTKIGDSIGGAVKSGLNGVLGMIEGTINKGIGLINGAIDLINKLPGVSVGKIEKLKLPRLKTGLDFVPSDYFPAYLDYGERVLTKEENQLYNQLGGLKGMLNSKLQSQSIIINNNDSRIERLIEKVEKLSERPIHVDIDSQTIAKTTASANDNVTGERINLKERGLAL